MTKESVDVNWGPKIHDQFVRQAKWTRVFRNQIYRQVGLNKARRILEIGCGTGVITSELRDKTDAKTVAIDIDERMIAEAKKNVQGVEFLVADAADLSMNNKTFDLVISQYLFLWLSDPKVTLNEMVRVCKKRGHVVALAEPDYGGWLEYPEYELGASHIKSLEKEGADPYMGRKIQTLFEAAGLETKISIIAQIWNKQNLLNNIEEEWERVLEAGIISNEDFIEKVKLEKTTIEKNQRMIFMPVFTALGKK